MVGGRAQARAHGAVWRAPCGALLPFLARCPCAPAADDAVAGAIDPSEEQPVSAAELDARGAVSVTGMPRACAACTSITCVWEPVTAISFRRGSASMRLRGKAMRSRMMQSTSKAASSSAASASLR